MADYYDDPMMPVPDQTGEGFKGRAVLARAAGVAHVRDRGGDLGTVVAVDGRHDRIIGRKGEGLERLSGFFFFRFRSSLLRFLTIL